MTINLDLRRVAEALERLAEAAERAYPPINPMRLASLKKAGPDAIVKYGDDSKLWMRETFSNLIHERGLAPGQEQEILDAAVAHALEVDEEE